MKTQAFISIGTKGTSLPFKLTELTSRLVIGVNVLRWANPGKVPEAGQANAWVSNNGQPFELYPLKRAVAEGKVRHLAYAAWTGQADRQRHVGEAFFPNWWQPGDPQPLLVAVRSKTWKHGCVELKLVRDGRNRDIVARFEPASLQVAGQPKAPQVAPAPDAVEWTDHELRATVAAYLQMLREEQTGQSYSKAKYNQRLREDALATRSKASVEFRMQNISAVLDEIGHPWIKGYKPHRHVGETVKARLHQLLRSVALEEFALYEPSADRQEVELRTSNLLRGPRLQRPVGEAAPKSVERATRQFVRDPKVQAFVRQEAAGKCELCREPAPFVDGDGFPFLEVHHVVALADQGPDKVENAAALCPNCHRHLHYGQDRAEVRARLYSQVSRLQLLR